MECTFPKMAVRGYQHSVVESNINQIWFRFSYFKIMQQFLNQYANQVDVQYLLVYQA
jgi:hypothetical protein